jgi:hypothetical protein
MVADANAPVEPLDQDLDRIIAELDAPFGHLPVEAIRAAQSNRDRIIPRLMQSLDGVVQTIQPDEKGKTNGAFFALFLLIEFRAAEAFDTIVRAVSLPGDLPSRLFGDAIHEVLPLAVPVMANDRLDDVLALIRNRKLGEFVRWAFVEGLVRLVRAEVRSRDEIVTILRQLLTEAIENKDIEVITPVINSLIDLYPEEAYDEIKRAYDVGLADEFMLSFEDVERQIDCGKERTLGELKRKPESIEDTVAELQRWAAFRPRPPKPASKPAHRELSPPRAIVPAPQPQTALRSSEPRVGRNEPCPCGSGKKYKKCCGSAAQRDL